MCGRYSLYNEEENREIMRIIKSLDERYPGNKMKTGEIFPTNTAPVICRNGEELRVELSMWGFPRFAAAKGVIINARAETANERPMFRKSLHGRRCAVPSTGFFEWTQNGEKNGEKIKYRFNLPGSSILYMAGIYNEFKDGNRFVILTTKANQSMEDVHNRMPVILPERNVEDWILSEDFALPYLGAVMPALRRDRN